MDAITNRIQQLVSDDNQLQAAVDLTVRIKLMIGQEVDVSDNDEYWNEYTSILQKHMRTAADKMVR